ncbi:MAG: hypothetical protein EZS28_034125 [Streblomastix strix]|uniref:Uncharacterized protein n=1 Tax=Streblomastix strix TaxID=222440 RepID=A0A5J4UI18_9EUKA|nr:MAG: hypothetical protein EZS28_034125 [Streblomastix strix]
MYNNGSFTDFNVKEFYLQYVLGMSCRQLSLRKIGCQHFANQFCTDNVTELFTKDLEKQNQMQTYKEQEKETKFGSEGKEKEDSVETLASTSLDGVQFISAEEHVTAIRQLKLVELALGKDVRVETMQQIANLSVQLAHISSIV